jgi:hypothetical protein
MQLHFIVRHIVSNNDVLYRLGAGHGGGGEVKGNIVLSPSELFRYSLQ